MVGPRKFKVLWTRTAQRDLTAIIEFIAEDDLDQARAVLRKIRKSAAKLYTLPKRGRRVPELLEYGIQSYRELIIELWRILYRISEEIVFVAAVIDSRRNVEDLLLERFAREGNDQQNQSK